MNLVTSIECARRTALLLGLAACGRVGFDGSSVVRDAAHDELDADTSDGPPCPDIPDVTNGLVLHWELEEPAGSTIAVDSSGGGNDGTLINAPLFKTGRIGQGLEFGEQFTGAQDQRLRRTSTTFDATGDLTISLWVHSYDSGNIDVLVDTDENTTHTLRLLIRNDAPSRGQLVVTSDGNPTQAESIVGALVYEAWQHVVLVRPASGSGVVFYVDTVDKTSTDVSGTPLPKSTFQVGGGGDTTSDYNGIVDDVRVYSRLLSLAEITQLYERVCP